MLDSVNDYAESRVDYSPSFSGCMTPDRPVRNDCQRLSVKGLGEMQIYLPLSKTVLMVGHKHYYQTA